MKSLAEFILTMITIFLSAVISYIAWGQIHTLFPWLPMEWHEMGFWKLFCFLWLYRVMTSLARFPDFKLPDQKK